ncbi:hypothetical protein COY32_01300 [candidate division WWE3 bacterium CG_4_10_14_0_2_um_filter_41_14]|uniref:Uncharacterized protein n=1 Tax=candidate division WWE3 bacterium CG_4_10_14_0_2_um_filter_41_14 TaxID=1975072 RepID=A0A2M7TKY7_UNCKA|nr:MAG: hypothetical protein COY32_01300 [candidate division WWE3 bacterium CG_4_10_14_0_2_um_filter_41_14]
MNNVFIYGVPGTGKTHISRLLGKTYGYTVIEGDTIKTLARKGKTKRTDPFLFWGTCLAYKHFGDMTMQNAINGLLGVRAALKDYVDQTVKSQPDTIIFEAAFVDPHSYCNNSKVFLVVTLDEKLHKKQFLSHREKLLDIKQNEFKSARMIQEFLIQEAQQLGVTIIENSPDLDLSGLDI